MALLKCVFKLTLTSTLTEELKAALMMLIMNDDEDDNG